MKLNDDKTRLSLRIDADLSAQQLDQLLQQLALKRANMTPAVPQTRSEVEATNAHVSVEDKPSLSIAARTGGGFRMWLRHRGFGWVAYQIDDRTALGMCDYISLRAVNHDVVNFISDDGANVH